jgi:hypothetical protein
VVDSPRAPDSAADASDAADAARDATAMDANGAASDAGDGSVTDAAGEGGGDGGDAADAAGDGASGDGSADGEAGTVLVPVGDFPKQASRAYCKMLAGCCCPGQDAGSTCESLLARTAEIFGLGTYVESRNDAGSYETVDSGLNILLDPNQAATCLAGIAALGGPPTSCSAETSSGHAALVRSCFSAMAGQVPLGATCRTSGECKEGYCAVGPDAGVGQCIALNGIGGACGTTPTYRSEECTYLGLGVPPNYCDTTSKCAPAQDLDAGCQRDWACQSYTCDSVGGQRACTDHTVIASVGTGFCPVIVGCGQ